MANFYALFATVLFEILDEVDSSFDLPIHIDEGDEGTESTKVAGIVYMETGERYLLLNATSAWWQTGDLREKMRQTIRHELRHLAQWQYIVDHFALDPQIVDFLMGTSELYGGYECNPYEIDAHKFETSTQDFNEGLEWIDQVVAH